MLDCECERTLKRITELCQNGYKVLGLDDFHGIINAEACLNRLAEGRYISLRYSHGGEYLLTLAEKGTEYFSEKENRIIFKSVLRRECAVYSFFGALLGAFCSATIVFLLFFLMRGAYA